MAKNIVVVERSPLAKNVYAMILSMQGNVNIVDVGLNENIMRFEDAVRSADLVILGESSIRGRRDEYMNTLFKISKEKKVSCVIVAHRGSAPCKKELASIRNIRVVERPFFPNELLDAISEMWDVV